MAPTMTTISATRTGVAAADSKSPQLIADYEEILARHGILDRIESVVVSEADGANEHLGGETFCVKVTFIEEGARARRQALDLFLKTPARHGPKFYSGIDTFYKESLFATVLLPKLRERARGIPELETTLDCFTRYYAADTERILMEDCVKGCGWGYKPVPLLTKLDRSYAEAVLEKLARFHSLTYGDVSTRPCAGVGALSPDEYVVQNPFLVEKFFAPGREFTETLFSNFVRIKLAILRNSATRAHVEHDGIERAITFIENGLGKVFAKLWRAVRLDGYGHEHTMHVVNLGDCWKLNLLFKTDPVTQKLLGLIFVDFQLTRLGSPTLDILYFLFSSVEPSVLRTSWRQLLKFYFEHLKDGVEKRTPGGFKHTFEQFLADFQARSPYGFWFSMVFFTGFEIAPYIDLGAMENDDDGFENGSLGAQVTDWIKNNESRAAELAADVMDQFLLLEDITSSSITDLLTN